MTAARTGDKGARRELGSQILDACGEVGFLYVTSHGIQWQLLEDCLDAGKTLFPAPLEDELKCSASRQHRGYVAFGDARMYGRQQPGQKESFNWALESAESGDCSLHGRNQRPRGYPRLEGAGYRYLLETMWCGYLLLRAIAVTLGLDGRFFERRYEKPIRRGGIIHYPPQELSADGDEFGVAPHTDYGCVTSLWQDSSGGLHVLKKVGDWINAVPVPDSYVVDVGDLRTRWTNGVLSSSAHRRIVNTSGHDRHSVVVFHYPGYSTVVDPRDVDPLDVPKHPPFGAGEHAFEEFADGFTCRTPAHRACDSL